jgi:hypothetical protein
MKAVVEERRKARRPAWNEMQFWTVLDGVEEQLDRGDAAAC